jgi:hypothetical protein
VECIGGSFTQCDPHSKFRGTCRDATGTILRQWLAAIIAGLHKVSFFDIPILFTTNKPITSVFIAI